MMQRTLALLATLGVLAALPAGAALPNACNGEIDVGSCERWVRRQADATTRPITEAIEDQLNQIPDGLGTVVGLAYYAYCFVAQGPDVPPAINCPP